MRCDPTAAHLQSLQLTCKVLYCMHLAETEMDEIEDNGKGPISFTLQRHGSKPIAIDLAYFRTPFFLTGHLL